MSVWGGNRGRQNCDGSRADGADRLVVLISVRVGAAQVVTDVVWHPPQLLAQLLFIPLLALWAIWVGIGISTRASDVRVAQQLATLAALPLLGLTALFSFQVIKPSVPLAVGLALALLIVDLAAWRAVSRLFDPERLITGRQGHAVDQAETAPDLSAPTT